MIESGGMLNNMKIKYDIQEKYKEIEIHICYQEKDDEATSIYESLRTLFDTKLRVVKGQETTMVVPARIIRIYTENKKVYVRTVDNCYEVKERLYILEKQLKDKEFVRISNSEIVNISQIEKLDVGHAGTIKMYMKNGDVTYVSRRCVSKIKEVLL